MGRKIRLLTERWEWPEWCEKWGTVRAAACPERDTPRSWAAAPMIPSKETILISNPNAAGLGKPLRSIKRQYLTLRLTLTAILGAVCSTSLAAQAPGNQRIDPGWIIAEYRAEVLERINDLLADWDEAWSEDNADELSSLYWEDAVIFPWDRPAVNGREAIRGYFAEILPQHGRIEAFMTDFDASGGMAQVLGNYMMTVQQGDETGTQRSGPMFTVYLRRGRHWRIRSQFFLPGTELFAYTIRADMLVMTYFGFCSWCI